MFHRSGIFLSIYGTQSFTLNLVRFPTSAVPNSLYYRLVDFQLFLWERKKKRWISFCPWFGAKHEKNQILSCNISLYYFGFFSKVALENSHFLIEPIFFCT